MINKNNIMKKLFYVILFVTLFTLGGCSTLLSEETMQGSDEANTNYEKGRSLFEEDKYEEAITYYLLALENVNGTINQEEIEDEDSQEDGQYNNFKNNIYNDLSESYYQLREYELSLKHIELALNIKPNRYFEYINLGNALYSLDRNDEAELNYIEALNLNKDAIYAIYGLGSLYFDNGNYEDALVEFEKYMEYESTDMDAIMYMIDCYSELSMNEEGLIFINEMLANNSDDIYLLVTKGELLSLTKSYEEVVKYYLELLRTYPDNIEIEISFGEHYYNNAMYDVALEYFMELSKKYPNYGEVQSWIIYCYEEMKEFDHLLEYYQRTTDNGNESVELFNAVGYAYMNNYRYVESVPYFKEAARFNPEEIDPYLNVLYGLYNGKRYAKCIEYGLIAIEKFPSDIDIPWYIGDCYYNLSDYQESIIYYKEAIQLDNENEEILAQIAEAYLMLEEYQQAEEYANKTLAIDSQNSISLYVKETIKDRQSPIGEQLNNFISDSYLYSEGTTDISKTIEELFAKGELSNAQIAKAVEEIKSPDDVFTFVISDEDYDYIINEQADDIEYRVEGNQVYLRLTGFYVNTDYSVIEILDEIEDTQNKNLIIDLRDNTGGLTDCANNILDLLLPECVTSTLISREGYTYNYYSDETQIKFNKIYILVNDYSASASELLTLGLKTYLGNVTIIGSNTYGKGVGQTVFEDKERKLLVYLVNHYWNVRQQNIMSTGITPDIYVKSNNLEDYMKIIKE
jgi:tetratricopeptide (TPR) repeat protein